MTENDHPHLNRKTLSISLVDDNLLADDDRLHLSRCAECRAKRTETAEKLRRLSQLAQNMVPPTTRIPELPMDAKALHHVPWKSIIKPAIGTAAAAVALLICLRLWPPLTMPNGTESDDQFMAEVSQLVNNVLSPPFQEVIEAIELPYVDDPTDFIVPEISDGNFSILTFTERVLS